MRMNVYQFQGDEGEIVPTSVRELTFNPGIPVVPPQLCYSREHLRQVTLPEGLIKICDGAFGYCKSLLEINIVCTVESIGDEAFQNCSLLENVELECSSSSSSSAAHNQLKTIGHAAFLNCPKLQQVKKIPSSVNMIGIRVFAHCQVLAEVDLSATAIKEIPMCAFEACSSLQTVSLPRSLERIGHASFMECTDLVTIIVPLDSKQPIEIEETSFQFCRSLANLVLPRGSTKVSMARYNASPGPPLLQDRFGEDMDSVIAGLISRFDDYPLHKRCYDHSSTTTTAQELRLLIGKDQGAMEASSLVDAFGMTPFHILFSTISPRRDLLQVLLDKLPCSGIILDWKDANGKLAVDYLLLSNFWNSDDNKMILFQMTIQAWMVDRLERWGATVWRSRMISLIDNLLVVVLLPAEDHDKERRMTAFRETLWSTWKRYEAVESTSILEMALWKRTLKSKWNNDNALDRNGYRVICGAGFVIPKVLQFLDTSYWFVPTHTVVSVE